MTTSATSVGTAFAAALSTSADTAAAVEEVCREASNGLQRQVDLAIVFVSPHHVEEFGALAADVQRKTQAKCLLGCTGESIVGTGREIEGQPAISLWLAHLPGVTATLEEEGELIAAAVYNPSLQESFTAGRGRGAFLNGQPIRVSKIEKLQQALVAASFSQRIQRDSPEISNFINVLVAQ